MMNFLTELSTLTKSIRVVQMVKKVIFNHLQHPYSVCDQLWIGPRLFVGSRSNVVERVFSSGAVYWQSSGLPDVTS